MNIVLEQGGDDLSDDGEKTGKLTHPAQRV